MTNSAFIGKAGRLVPKTSASLVDPNPQALAIVNDAADVDVELRIESTVSTHLTAWEQENSYATCLPLTSPGINIPFRGALVEGPGVGTGPFAITTTAAPIDWDNVRFDTDGFFSAGSPTRFTIPTGLGIEWIKLIFVATITGGGTSVVFADVRRNGAGNNFGEGNTGISQHATNQVKLSFSTPPIKVNDGDFFEIWADINGGTASLPHATSSYWGIEVIPSNSQIEAAPFRGVLVDLTVNEAITASTPTKIPWDEEQFDTDGFWTIGTPTRLTIPSGSGITKIQLFANLGWQPSATGTFRSSAFFKSGSETFEGSGSNGMPPATGHVMGYSMASAPIIVAEGDYFELDVEHDASGPLNINTGPASWFALRVLESVHLGNALNKFGSHTEITADDTGTTEDDVVGLTAILIPGADGVRDYDIGVHLGLAGSVAEDYSVKVYAGPDGDSGDTLILDRVLTIVTANDEIALDVSSLRLLAPAVADKIGITVTQGATGTWTVRGASDQKAWVTIREVDTRS